MPSALQTKIEMAGLTMLLKQSAPTAPQSLPRGACLRFALLVALTVAASDAQAVGGSKNKPLPKIQAVSGISLLGSYLAGHVARSARDSDNAALYYERALAKDPRN